MNDCRPPDILELHAAVDALRAENAAQARWITELRAAVEALLAPAKPTVDTQAG